jgi:hypothetical protein
MDHTPPPFFKRGPAPLVRLFFFASLSLALLVIDARFRYAEGLRSWLALAAYPLQRAATVGWLRSPGPTLVWPTWPSGAIGTGSFKYR